MRLLWLLMMLAGCPGSGIVTPDAADAGGDGSQSDRGMFVTWRADPALPGMVDDDLMVTEAIFQIARLEIIADSGSESTTRRHYVLAWSSQGTPAREAFPDAALGVYSRISLAVMRDGLGESAYVIRGTWRNNGRTIPYEIADRATLVVGFDCDATLTVGRSVMLGIEVDLKGAISGIDFRTIVPDNGVLRIEGGAELARFRDRLRRAFKAKNDDDDKDNDDD